VLEIAKVSLGGDKVAEICPRGAQGIFRVPEIYSRWIRCALGQYLVTGVCLGWVRHTLGSYYVAEVCLR
jgi:hypothetical protein